jgi:hypothetical protein
MNSAADRGKMLFRGLELPGQGHKYDVIQQVAWSFEETAGSGILTPQTRVGSRMAAEFSSIFSRTLFVMKS